LPKVNIVGELNKQLDTEYQGFRETSEALFAQVSVPLYEGGNIYSQTRQAVQNVGQRKSQTDDARRAALQSATQAWETIRTEHASIESLQSTIRAAEIALEGERQEQQVGSRTVIDVLNAEQELFSDQVNLVVAQHDLAVAEFNLSQQIGRLTALDLKLPVSLYNVETHYKAVRDKWIGFDSEPAAPQPNH
jgi:outer membrane protein